MAKTNTYSWGTPKSSVSLSVPSLDPQDLVIKQDDPSMVTAVYLPSPADAPETWKFGSQEIKDIYKDTGITPTCRSSSNKGVQIMIRNDEFIITQDAADPTYYKTNPIGTWLCCRTAVNSDVTDADVKANILRNFSGWILDLESPDSHIMKMIRGCLNPKE